MAESRISLDASMLSHELKLIEYPGIVKNDENMLRTLGGVGRISQVFCEQVRRMELVFHPDNRYAKATYGELQNTAGILIKVKVRKARNSSNVETAPVHSVQVLGHVRKTIKFTSLCDFQYLPIIRNPQSDQFTYIYDKIMPNGIPDSKWLSDPKQPLFIVPAVFSRADTVQTNIFRLDHHASKSDGDVIGVLRNRTNEHRMCLEFSLTEPIPTKPNPTAYKAMMAKVVKDDQFERIKKLLDECPIWNTVALLYEANITTDKLKTIVPALCYYYRTGPWRTMHVRFGYDPRKHFESRYYQTFDYRIRFGARLGAHIKTKRRAGYPKGYDLDLHASEGTHIQDVHYPYFEDGRLPRGRQSFYRYCDIRIPKVKEMLDKLPTPLSGATCNEKTGWLPANFCTEVRAIMYSSIRQSIRAWRKMSGGKEIEVEEEVDDFEDVEEIEDDDEEEEDDEAEETEEYDQNDDIDIDAFMNEVENE